MRVWAVLGTGVTPFLLAFALWLGSPQKAEAIPYFARKYNTECRMCHVIPPKLNETGERFLAQGYSFEGQRQDKKAFPVSVWATWRGERNLSRQRGRGLVNRVELISAGRIAQSKAFYFVEWLPVSQQVGSNNEGIERHGRFEDVFASLPAGPLFLTFGQFRPLTQVDVSRRLSLSEPMAFSTGVAGKPALSSRLTGLRSFSLSGRSPAIRVSHHWQRGERKSDGWYNLVSVPFAGEFVIPLTSKVHRTQGFEFEFRPRGVLMESYYRYGLNSFGGNVFIGNGRELYSLVGSLNRGRFFSTLGLAFAHELNGREDTRLSWENEFVPWRWLALGLRLDDRTGTNRPAALIPHVNVLFPQTKYTVRVTVEHRQQRGNRQWLLEMGTVF